MTLHPMTFPPGALLGLFLVVLWGCSSNASLGLFEAHGDVGDVGRAGSVEYDAGTGRYLVSGSGEDMWFDADAFHYVWKQVSGDVTLAADVRLPGTGGHPHRKAGLILRQSLAPEAPYADVVVHGNGLTALQYREVPGGPTREIQSNVTAPHRIRIEKEGDYVALSVAGEDGVLHTAGGTLRIRLQAPFLIGLGVCAHDNDTLAQASFSHVELTEGEHAEDRPEAAVEPALESTLEVLSVATGDRRVVYHARAHFEAPNWSRDGAALLFNGDGRLYRIPVEGGTPRLIDTGFATRLNNDHGLSPDGTLLAISDQSQADGQSRVYVLPAGGGTPRRLTARGPSYWHGWSPDGRTLAFVGLRNDEYDIYTVPVAGGPEKRLTSAPGLDDGPDYAPDGRYIYFNSVRTGTMQIWRMNADGSAPQQLTFDDYNDWFPHPSPDGRWIVFLSYEPGVEGHPPNHDVMLRLMPADGGEVRVLAKFFGGQGTINVPSWSPDGTQVAFVSYRLVSP